MMVEGGRVEMMVLMVLRIYCGLAPLTQAGKEEGSRYFEEGKEGFGSTRFMKLE